MTSTGSPRRYGRLLAVAIGASALVAGMLAATVPAQAATTVPAKVPASFKLPMTVSPDGWITYTDALAPKLGLSGLKTTTVTGKVAAKGGCDFSGKTTLTRGAPGTYTEEVAFNPRTCQARFDVGRVTPTALAKLNALAGSEKTASTRSASTRSSAVKSGAAVRAASTFSTSAYEKSAWIDPLDITITSLADDLTWTSDGTYWYTANATVYPYEFAYDGWTNSGTPPVHWSSTASTIGINESESFYNVDFQIYVLAALGLAAYLVCTNIGTVATFNLNDSITGLASGGFDASWNDSASGACANLVHHGQWDGFGSTS